MLGGLRQPPEEALDLARLEIEPDAAHLHQAAAEAVATQLEREVEELAAQAPEVRGRRQVAHVTGERAHVPRVVGEPLELEAYRADEVAARRDLELRERLERHRVGGGVPDAGVPGEGLGDDEPARGRGAEQQGLGAAVLVAEVDLEGDDLLAAALEAKVPGLDDPCVHRADRDLVDARAFDPEEGVSRRRARRALLERKVAAQRLEPGVALGPDAVELEDLALEGLGLRRLGAERGVAPGLDAPAHHRELADRVVGEHGEQLGLLLDGGDEERAEAGARIHRAQAVAAEGVGLEPRHLVEGEGDAVLGESRRAGERGGSLGQGGHH